MFNQQINNLVNAGYSPDDIEAWRVQRRAEMAGLGHTDNEIDNEIGRETRGTFNNQAWRTVFEKPENVKFAQPKELRPVFDAANEMEGGAAAEKYAVTAFMAQKYDLDPKALLMHYDLAMEKYFGEVLTPQEHYRRIGEELNPKRPKPEVPPHIPMYGARGAMGVPTTPQEPKVKPEAKQGMTEQEIAQQMPEMFMGIPVPKYSGDPEDKKKLKDAAEKMRAMRVGTISASTATDEQWQAAKKKGAEYFPRYKQAAEYLEAKDQLANLNQIVENIDAIPLVPTTVANNFKAILIGMKNSDASSSDTSMGLYSAIKDYAAELGMGQRTEDKMESTMRFQRTVNGMFRELAADEKSQGMIREWASKATEAVNQMLVSLIIGGPVGVPIFFGASAAGDAYSSMRDANIDPSVAAPVAIVTGALTGAIENMVSFVPGARTWLKGSTSILGKMAIEILEEGADVVNRKGMTDIVANKLQGYVNMTSDAENAKMIPERIYWDIARDSLEAMGEAATIVPVLAATGGALGGAGAALQYRDANLPSIIDQRQLHEETKQKAWLEENRRQRKEQKRLRDAEEKANKKQSVDDQKKADEDAREYLLSEGVPAKTIASMKSEQLQQAVAAKKAEGTPSTTGVEQINAEVRATQAGETLAEQKPAVDAINADVRQLVAAPAVATPEPVVATEAPVADTQAALPITDDTQAVAPPVVLVSDEEFRDIEEIDNAYAQARDDVKTFNTNMNADMTKFSKILEEKLAAMPEDDRLAKADLRGIIEMLKRDVPATERRSWTSAVQDVLKNGTIERVPDILNELKLDKNRLLSDEESIAVVSVLNRERIELNELLSKRAKAAMDKQLNTVEELSKLIEIKTDKVVDLSQVALKARSRAGRALAIGNMHSLRYLKPEQFKYTVEKAKGEILDPELDKDLIAKLEEITQKYLEIEAENVELAKRLQDSERRTAEAEAKKEAKDIIRKRRNRTREQNQAERQDILKEFSKLGHRVNEAMSSLGMGIEGLSLMSRLIRTYVEDGLTEMDEIVDRVKNDLPDATEFDVWSALAAKRNQTERVEKAATKMMAELKKQAKLELELDAFNKGIEVVDDKGTRTVKMDSERVIELKNALAKFREIGQKAKRTEAQIIRRNEILDSVQNQLDKMYRNIKDGKDPVPDEVKAIDDKISEIKQLMRYEDRFSELQEIKETGVEPAKKEPKVLSDRVAAEKQKVTDMLKELAQIKRDKQKPIKQQKAVDKAQEELDKINDQIDKMYRKIPEKEESKERNLELEKIKKAINEANEYMATIDRVAELRNQKETGEKPEVKVPTAQEKSQRIKDAREEESDLKLQIKLQQQIDDMLAGVKKPKVEPTEKEASAEVKAMRDILFALRKSARETELNDRRLAKLDETVNKLEDMLENEHRAIKEKRKPDPEAVAKRKEKIKELRQMMRIEDRISDLELQRETNNFGLFEQPAETTEVISDEMKKNRVKLKLLEKEVRLMAENAKPKDAVRKITSTIAIPTQAMRMLAAGGEFSMVLRQGLFMTGYMVMTGGKGMAKTATALVESFKAMKEKRYHEIFLAMNEDPKQYYRLAMNLDITDPMHRLSEEESSAGIKALGYIPWIKFSNRQGVAYLNLMRIAMFDAGVEMHPEWDEKQVKLWAGWVNAVSGRSRLQDFIKPKGMEVASVFMFAPNFAASRIETYLRAGHALTTKDPGFIKEVGRTIAGYSAFNLMFSGMMWLAGAEFGDDPEEFDLGRWSIGNTKFDLYAGMNLPFVAAIRSGMHVAYEAGYGDMKGRAFSENVLKYLSNKQAPLFPFIKGFGLGKDFWGQDQPRWQIALETLPPMYWKSIWDAAQASQFWSTETIATILTGIGGGSATTIDNELLKPRIRDLYKHVGIKRIDGVTFPKEIKEDRDLIAERENLDKAFFMEVAQFLVKERKFIETERESEVDQKLAKKYINEWISYIRKNYEYKSEKLKKGTK